MSIPPDEEWKIHHDYEIALRNLNPVGWPKMSEQEKIANFQAIENKIALDEGRIPAEIRAEMMPAETMGYQQGNTIVYNTYALQGPNFMESVDTAYHEGSHVRDWQAQFLPEVRDGYAPEELEARSTPIPEPQADWEGYWNHPAEQAAREAGEVGVAKTLQEQARIAQVDREIHEAGPVRNQILETYDYLALEGSPPSPETTHEVTTEWSWEITPSTVTDAPSPQAETDSPEIGADFSDSLDAANVGADTSYNDN